MTEIDSEGTPAVEDWPTFALRYTFNPGRIGLDRGFEADEVVVFDATRGRLNDRWIAAKRGSYVSVEEIR
ncbi:hypothetical protein HAPAU_26480 [Halalkalicoccus paucihalophilus]|uniref:Uncharacterized protein n=1 Tax=Halalkalicoccus paucihalophilus TaxID=1008153 RepID=A0A151ACD2_9EURY|nr:hypothetical protein [Halalkalicoccus paucihalophilus]KYH25263.1 hypothetical protein HAPAU_26480 [Halalkalicoccus paucihalophilus]